MNICCYSNKKRNFLISTWSSSSFFIFVFLFIYDLNVILCGKNENLIDNVNNLGSAELLINNLNNLLYQNGSIYIGGENVLLKLNADSLTIENRIRYGPIYDSNKCKYYPKEECLMSTNEFKSLKNNYNKLMLVYKSSMLISCWTGYQCTCDIRDLNDLNREIMSSKQSACANDLFNSTIGYISESPSSQDLLLIATTYNSNGVYRDDIPAVAGRSLSITQQQLGVNRQQQQQPFMQILTNNQGLKESKASIDFLSRQLKTFIVKYVYGFTHGIYNYLLTVQHMDGATTSNDLLITKLIRICKNDLSFIKTYIELPLKCEINGVYYNELINAKFINDADEPQQQQQQQQQQINDDSNKYIIGLFESTKRTSLYVNSTVTSSSQNGRNSGSDQSDYDYDMNGDSDEAQTSTNRNKQAICVFSLKDIKQKIKESLRNCYVFGNVSRGLSFIKQDQQCLARSTLLSSLQQNTGGKSSSTSNNGASYDTLNDNIDDYCSIDVNSNSLYPIGSRLNISQIHSFDINTNIKFNHLNLYKSKSSKFNQFYTMPLLSNNDNQLSIYQFNKITDLPNAKLQRVVKLEAKSTLPNRKLLVKSPNTNLVFNTNGTKLYLIHKNYVYKVNMELSDCNEFKTCKSCLQQASDLNCGWCSRTSSCTTVNQCTTSDTNTDDYDTQTVSSKWYNLNTIDDNVASCVDIDYIEPSVITLDKSQKWIEVNFNDNNGNGNDESLTSGSGSGLNQYQCVFGMNDTRTDIIRLTQTKYKCSLPHDTYIEQYQLKHEQNVFTSPLNNDLIRLSSNFSLPIYIHNLNKNVYYGVSNLANGSIVSAHQLTIIDCNRHKSCSSCFIDSQYCKWCSNKCVSVSEYGNNGDVSRCASGYEKCESYNAFASKLFVPFIFGHQQATIFMNLINVDESNDDLTCMITSIRNTNLTFTYSKLNATHSQCLLRNVFEQIDGYLGELNGELNTNLRLYNKRFDYFIDSKNDSLELKFYKCEQLASDCSKCMAISKEYSCIWCNNALPSSIRTCKFMPTINTQRFQQFYEQQQCVNKSQTCDKAKILDVRPLKIPLGGGTLLKINGVNLGSSVDEIKSIELCDKRCKIGKYETSKRVECQTENVSHEKMCRLNVWIRDEKITWSDYIYYVDPQIIDIKPNQIIQSANGIYLKIVGKNLDAGISREITLIDSQSSNSDSSNYYKNQQQQEVKCEITNVSDNEIICRLNERFRLLGKKNLKITYDQSMSIMHYTAIRVNADPIILNISKTETIVEGGTKFELKGYNFDIIQSIFVFVKFTRNLWVSQPIQVFKRVSNERLLFKFPRLQQQQQSGILNDNKYELNIGFMMDGYNKTLKEKISYYKYPQSTNLFQMSSIDRLDNGVNEQLVIINFNEFRTQFENKFKDDLSLYVKTKNMNLYSYCECDEYLWLNETYLSCKLQFNCNIEDQVELVAASTGSQSIDFSETSSNNYPIDSLIRLFLGNYEIRQVNVKVNDDFKGYMRNEYKYLIDLQLTVNGGGGTNGTMNQGKQAYNLNRIIIICTSIILFILFILLLFIICIYYTKKIRKTKEHLLKTLNNNAISQQNNTLIEFKNCGKKGGHLSSNDDEDEEDCEYKQVKTKINYLEYSLKSQCKYLYDKMQIEYLNEFNTCLLYTGVPQYTYKTYLLNILFTNRSNFYINRLLSPNNLYATIKSETYHQLTNNNNNNALTTTSSLTSSATSGVGTTTNGGQIGQNVYEAMHIFDQLLRNKIFLQIFTQTCEKQCTFNCVDRSQFASLLLLALKDNLPYLYSIIKQQLSDLISKTFNAGGSGGSSSSSSSSSTSTTPTNSNQTVVNCLSSGIVSDTLTTTTATSLLSSTQTSTTSSTVSSRLDDIDHPQQQQQHHSSTLTKTKAKLLFRQSDTIVEKLLSNWISMFMYQFIKDHLSITIYRLIKVIKYQINSGPVDMCLQQAKYCINEERLLKPQLASTIDSYKCINVNLIAFIHDQTRVYKCNLLDCDTIKQAKEKLLDAIYFNCPFTQRPSCNDIELELRVNATTLDPSQQYQQHNSLVSVTSQSTSIYLKEYNECIEPINNVKYRQLLTIRDYFIADGSYIYLTFNKKQLYLQQQQQQQQYYVTLNNGGNSGKNTSFNTISSNGRVKYYHLVKPSVDNQLTMLTNSGSTANTTATTAAYFDVNNDGIMSIGESQTIISNKKLSKKLSKKNGKGGFKFLQKNKQQKEKMNSREQMMSSLTIYNDLALTRLLLTKGTIQPFIDDLFETIFTNTSNLPPIIKHLFDFFDCEFKKYNCNDTNITKLWKNNTYFLRYWINIIKNPQFLYDIDKTILIDSSLTCIAQAFMDSCSVSEQVLAKHSPTNKLLFANDVTRYRNLIDNFYNEIQSYQHITDHELHFYLNEFSKCQPNDINTIEVLLGLYEYYEKYEKQINATLGQQQCSILLPLHHKLVQIRDLMSNQTPTTTIAGGGTIINTNQNLV